MVSFESTEIAFRSKSDRDLNKAYLLFRIISSRTIVKTGGFLSKSALKIHFPINWLVKPTIYNHFCGGETIDECIPTVQKLSKFNVKSILDFSVEGKEDPDEIRAALEETLRTIDNAARQDFIPFTVFKPTAFAISKVLEKKSEGKELTPEEHQEYEKFRNRVDTLCKRAYELNVPIMVDAEHFCVQTCIDEVVMEMMEKYNHKKAIVYNTYQMYRRDRMEVFRRDLETARKKDFYLGIKFVRGAYLEKERERAARLGYPSPIHPDKESTDRAYDSALKYAVENIDRVSIFNGTHNEKSSLLLTQLMEEHGITRDDFRCYFSQLYGMSDHISFNLASEGYNVAKYLPYGPVRSVLPYLIRRTEENTSIAGQTGRELKLISMERKRRKSQKSIKNAI
jgi:proline dehydrogenase